MADARRDKPRYAEQVFAFARQEGIPTTPLLCLVRGVPDVQRLRSGKGKRISVGRIWKVLDNRWDQLIAKCVAGEPAEQLHDWLESERETLPCDGIRIVIVRQPSELTDALRELPGNALADGGAGNGVWIMKWHD